MPPTGSDPTEPGLAVCPRLLDHGFSFSTRADANERNGSNVDFDLKSSWIGKRT